jgi:hypothetical protein
MSDSPQHLFVRVQQRVKAIHDKFATGLEPEAKELRQFPVHVMPMIVTCATVYLAKGVAAGGTVSGRWYILPHVIDILQLGSATDKILDGLFKQLDHRTQMTQPPPKVKLTSKLCCSVSGKTLFISVQELLKAHSEVTSEAMALDGLLTQLRVTVPSPEVISSFLHDLASLYLDGSIPFLNQQAEISSFRAKWCVRDPSLTLCTKLYFARGDWRAFYSCTSILAHICGAVLETLLVPKTARLYCQTYYAVRVPYRGKNILHIAHTVEPHETVASILLDIASFTSSNCNSHGLIFMMWYLLRNCESLEKFRMPIVVTIGGEYMKVSLERVLEWYLFETVLAPVVVKSTGNVTFSHGGYLGVPANMQITVMASLLVLEGCMVNADELNVRMDTNPGQDDIHLLLRGEPSAVAEMITLIESQLAKYVGKMKEFTVNFLEVGSQGTLGEFCQKEVRYVRTDKELMIDSVDQLPLLDCLFGTPYAYTNQWRSDSFLANIRDATRQFGKHQATLIEVYIRAYEHKYASRLDTTRGQREILDRPWIVSDGVAYTYNVQRVASGVITVKTERGLFRDSMREKVLYLCHYGYVRVVRDGIIYVEKDYPSVVVAAPRVQLERIDNEEIRECLGLLVTAMTQ